MQTQTKQTQQKTSFELFDWHITGKHNHIACYLTTYGLRLEFTRNCKHIREPIHFRANASKAIAMSDHLKNKISRLQPNQIDLLILFK